MKTDEDLIREFAAGAELAFAALYRRFERPVYLFALRMLGSSDEALDALQSVFLKVYEEQDRLASILKVRPWLFTIARNHCLNILRDRSPLERLEEDLALESASDPLGEAARAHEAQLVGAALARLGVKEREALILREYQNLSYEEIADVTASSLSAVKSRIFKARQQMAGLLRDAFAKG